METPWFMKFRSGSNVNWIYPDRDLIYNLCIYRHEVPYLQHPNEICAVYTDMTVKTFYLLNEGEEEKKKIRQ